MTPESGASGFHRSFTLIFVRGATTQRVYAALVSSADRKLPRSWRRRMKRPDRSKPSAGQAGAARRDGRRVDRCSDTLAVRPTTARTSPPQSRLHERTIDSTIEDRAAIAVSDRTLVLEVPDAAPGSVATSHNCDTSLR